MYSAHLAFVYVQKMYQRKLLVQLLSDFWLPLFSLQSLNLKFVQTQMFDSQLCWVDSTHFWTFSHVLLLYSLLLRCVQKAVLLMMGSADELPQAPAQATQFVEDMTDAEIASAVSPLVHLK